MSITSYARLGALAALLLSAASGLAAAAAAAGAPARGVEVHASPGPDAHVWLETSLRRIYPDTPPGSADLRLLAARNGRISFQVAFRNDHERLLFTECAITGADDLNPRVRLVGLVPVRHVTPFTPLSDIEGRDNIPGLVPDPLLPTTKAKIGPSETRSYWVSLHVPGDAKPGPRTLTVRFAARSNEEENKPTVIELPVQLEVSQFVIQPRKNFPVTHWWQAESTWNYYKTGRFEDPRWWEITRAQLANMLDHGCDVIMVPIFFNRPEPTPKPAQLLVVNEVSPGKYEFDWSQVKKFTDLAKEIGFKQFEWSHLWMYGGVKTAIPVYTQRDGQFVKLWPRETQAFSDTYLGFLKQFLPEFQAFLDREGLLEHSYFHLSDEPGKEAIENYRRARQFLREHAPWIKTMDALSDIAYGKERVTDIPIPQLGFAHKYVEAEIPHWVYYCCSPKGEWLNRFMDTPLTKIRMSGMLFHRFGAGGFLHWGFNYWHKISSDEVLDPFTDGSAADYPAIPYGDPFVIYPGPDGKPIDSLRWEVFAESLQDYAILQTAGIRPDDPLLADLKSYKDFPRDADWIRQTIEKVLQRQPVTAATAAQ